MNILLNIGIHSFTDAISNSSSETMICAGNQTVSTIKQIIEQLVDIYNSESELYNSQNKDKEHFWPKQIIKKDKIWTNIFQEPEIAEFEITIPEKVKELNKSNFENGWMDNYAGWIGNREFNLRSLEEKVNQEIRDFHLKSPAAPYPDRKLEEIDKKLYDKQFKAHCKSNRVQNKLREKLQKKYFKDWYKYCEKQLVEMWQLNCAQNDIDFKDLGKYFFTYWGENVSIRFNREIPQEKKPLPENIQRFISEVFTSESYSFDIKKGSIIINSASDNSIPFDLVEKIKEVLSARRIHLG